MATSGCFVAVVKTTDIHVLWGLTGMTGWCVPRPRGGGRCLSLRECTPRIPHRSRWGVNTAAWSAKESSQHHTVMWSSQLVSIVFSFSVLRFTFIHGNGRAAKTIISQGVVTFMSRVEAFAKLNQAIKVFFESWSRWPPNCTDQEHIAAIFDPWTTENQVIKGFERKGTIKWSRTFLPIKKCWFQSQTPQHISGYLLFQ